MEWTEDSGTIEYGPTEDGYRIEIRTTETGAAVFLRDPLGGGVLIAGMSDIDRAKNVGLLAVDAYRWRNRCNP